MFGGFFGAIAGVYIYSKIKNIKFSKITDILAPGFALGVFIYRIGCVFTADHPGKITSVPWGIVQADEFIRHPVSAYHSLSGLLLFIILLTLIIPYAKKHKIYDGWISYQGLIIFGALRFLAEFFRTDNTFFGLTTSQYISIILILFGTFMVWKNEKRLKRKKKSS
jgi:phosphatidylglycerol:prolipoprotein diacylglycerol transferase